MNSPSNPKIHQESLSSLRQKRLTSILFQIGSLLAYAAIANFVIHAIMLVRLKVSAELPIVLYAVGFCIQQLLQLPYKWDKFWLRIQSTIAMLAYGFVFILFIYTRVAPGFKSLSECASASS